ncbi:hypothetical protein DENSPDRAFT_926378 [Dentipellis sp. KUC8613]|nr:hypothetical protein DENSPDRAFT_926378 [Dentipellis sp. KUC8613]
MSLSNNSSPAYTPRAPSPFFRRRPLGRAPSPPTWACYEQIHAASDFDPEFSCSDSDDDEHSEDDAPAPPHAHDDEHSDSDSESEGEAVVGMDVDEPGDAEKKAADHAHRVRAAKDKGKQRAVEPEPAPAPVPVRPSRRRERQRRQPSIALRPILTIQRSQGFVWNQDLFVPPYIKDRYVASTSPPTGGFISTSASSTNTIASINDYEVEVVEIRVREGELEDIIP